jgi:hypothetical protein
MKDIYVICGRVMDRKEARTYYYNRYVHMKDTTGAFYWDDFLGSALKFSSISEAKEWWKQHRTEIIYYNQSVDYNSITIQKLMPYIAERL